MVSDDLLYVWSYGLVVVVGLSIIR